MGVKDKVRTDLDLYKESIMGVKDKVRTDLDLYKESILGMGCMLLKGLTLK